MKRLFLFLLFYRMEWILIGGFDSARDADDNENQEKQYSDQGDDPSDGIGDFYFGINGIDLSYFQLPSGRLLIIG